jgi:outer membrane protein assembly factor BamA
MRGTIRTLAVSAMAAFLIAFGAPGLSAQAGDEAKPVQETQTAAPAQDTIPDKSYKSWSPMPIVMYDTDIGFGFGGKVKFVDFLKHKESFDLILFQSLKNGGWTENWYVFTFSIPDFEIRQNRRYGLSFDLKAEYDKYLHYSYYGTGRYSSKDDDTVFSHAMSMLQLTLGRGFSPRFVAELSYALRWLEYSNVEDLRPFTDLLRRFGKQFSPFASLAARYDTSNSQIHPTRGIRLLFQDDLAVGSSDAKFNRMTFDFRNYITIFGEKDVFAYRGLFQWISGDKIPYFDLSSLGGGTLLNTMRGYPLHRFMDKAKFLANIEYRFPIWWRLGGNVFIDAGTVGSSLAKLDFGHLALDYGVGLRFYLNDFCVRVDTGFSEEGMGLYFNFGHIF